MHCEIRCTRFEYAWLCLLGNAGQVYDKKARKKGGTHSKESQKECRQLWFVVENQASWIRNQQTLRAARANSALLLRSAVINLCLSGKEIRMRV